MLADPGSEVYTSRTFSDKRYESNVLNSFGHPEDLHGHALPLRIGIRLKAPAAKARIAVTLVPAPAK